LIVSDLNLPGVSGISFDQAGSGEVTGAAGAVSDCDGDGGLEQQGRELGCGGRTLLSTRAEFCTNTEHWLAAINGLIEQTRAAA